MGGGGVRSEREMHSSQHIPLADEKYIKMIYILFYLMNIYLFHYAWR